MNPAWHEIRFRRDHRWTRLHMSAYLDSELQTQLIARLEQHTAECPQCHAVLSQLHRMLILLEAVPAPLPAVDVTAIATAVIQRLNASATD